MDSIDRFVRLLASGNDVAPGVDVSCAVLRTIRERHVRAEQVDYLPLAFSVALAVAASVFVMLSLPGALAVDRSVVELVNPISMLVP